MPFLLQLSGHWCKSQTLLDVERLSDPNVYINSDETIGRAKNPVEKQRKWPLGSNQAGNALGAGFSCGSDFDVHQYAGPLKIRRIQWSKSFGSWTVRT